MTYAFFPGCIVPNRYAGIEYATRFLLEKKGFNLDYVDVNSFSCCPVPGIFYSSDKDTWLALAARNLCLAQDSNLEILTICNGCFASLLNATEYLSDTKKRGRVNKILRKIGKKYKGVMIECESRVKKFEPVKVRHFVEVLYNDVGIEKIQKKVKHEMKDIRVAVHYGCHYLRPTMKSTIEDPNNPIIIDEMVEAIGGISVDYEDKLACCGAGGGIRSHIIELANSLTKDKLDNMRKEDVDCIVTPCPFCLLQFDSAQRSFDEPEIPVLHVSQFLALSMGVDQLFLGFDLHKVSINPLLRKLRRR